MSRRRPASDPAMILRTAIASALPLVVGLGGRAKP
jgi:hypothetical protein